GKLETSDAWERVPVQRDRSAIGLHEAGERGQKRRFAGTIGADHGDEFAAVRMKRRGIENRAAAAPDRDVVRVDPRHGEVRRSRTTSQKKNGVPMRLVNTPSFISGPSVMSRVAMSAAMSRAAPASEAGRRMRLGW